MPAASRPVAPVNRLPGLDVIRGLAIALVLLRHAWPTAFDGAGIIGVVIFFALSGYLITGVLLRDLEALGRVRFSRFYAHRAFRLVPALVFALAGFALIEGIWNILGARSEILRTTIVGLTYTMNIPAFDRGSEAMRHLWTLATEEQFYLVWPLVLVFTYKRGLSTKAGLVGLIGLLGLCAATIVLVYPAVHRVYELPTSWAAAMLLGAVAKLNEGRLDAVLTTARRRLITPIAFIGLGALSVAPLMKEAPATYLIFGPAAAVLALLLVFSLKHWTHLPSPGLRPIKALGLVSYAAYLWNYPVVSWLGQGEETFTKGVLGVLLTLVVAAISWYAVEKPAAKLRRRYDLRANERSSTTVTTSSTTGEAC